MVDLSETNGGILLLIKARPKARKNAVTGLHCGQLKVSVTEAPEKGKANGAIEKVLAESLGVRKSQIELVRGATSTQKAFLIRDVSAEILFERIDALGVSE